MKVSIVTLTYNHIVNTKEYLETLFRYTKPEMFELIVVDNGSTDGTVEYLKELKSRYDNIRIICNTENLGYSKGNNIGIKAASGDIVCLQNNDILLSPHWLEPILECFKEKEDMGLIAPIMLVNAKANTGLECKKENYLSFGTSVINSNTELCQKSLYPQFSCVLFKKEITNIIGLLDENFTPAFFEDDDFTIRVWRAGYSNYICTRSFYFHNHSQTSKYVDPSVSEKNRAYIKEKNYLAYELVRLYSENERLNNELSKTISWKIKKFSKKLFNFLRRVKNGVMK